MNRLAAMRRYLILLIVGLAGGLPASSQAATNAVRPLVFPSSANGELGCDIDFLRNHSSGPRGSGESNFFIDLWAEQNLRKLAVECGLTNNHALFINSHGVGVL